MNGQLSDRESKIARTYEWVLNLTSTHVNFNNDKALNIRIKNVKRQGLSCPIGGRIMCTTPLENDLGT